MSTNRSQPLSTIVDLFLIATLLAMLFGSAPPSPAVQAAARISRDELAEASPQAAQVKRAQPKVGRNDPCPCGSGRKYKYCHGR